LLEEFKLLFESNELSRLVELVEKIVFLVSEVGDELRELRFGAFRC